MQTLPVGGPDTPCGPPAGNEIRIGLMLPLRSGGLAGPAEAVRAGFMAAYERDRTGFVVNLIGNGRQRGRVAGRLHGRTQDQRPDRRPAGAPGRQHGRHQRHGFQADDRAQSSGQRRRPGASQDAGDRPVDRG
ncbi:hypothetical protein LP419_20250 [Massilia sp. H-1]|nr:hypothetical protein LP419_20250 [Massilia sp. H-1]